MGKTSKNFLPLWLPEVEDREPEIPAKPPNFFFAQTTALFTSSISLLIALFIFSLKILPPDEAQIICPPEVCTSDKLTLLLYSLPVILIIGFGLNLGLCCGIRFRKPTLLTLWLNVYEMMFYVQIFLQMLNIIPLLQIIQSNDILTLMTSWIIPMILLWLNNNARQRIYNCRQQIRTYLGGKARSEALRPLQYLMGRERGRDKRHYRSKNAVLYLPKFNAKALQKHFNLDRRSDKVGLI